MIGVESLIDTDLKLAVGELKDMKGKMKAARLHGPNMPLVIEDIDIPQIGHGEALVKIKACGVCHSDLGIIERGPNITLGHEAAGDIVDLGQGNIDFKIGDPVTIFMRFVCGECEYCLSGRDNLCANLKGQIGFRTDGGYAEYCKVPLSSLFRLPEGMSYGEGGILADCVATTYRALVIRGQVRVGSNIMVQGIGGLGASSILISKMLGTRVIAVDIKDDKLEFAKKLGADDTVNAVKESVPDAIKRLTNNKGVDYVIDLAGVGKAVETSLACVGKCGKILQVGHTNSPFTATSDQLFSGEKEIIGVTANSRKDILDVINLYKVGKLNYKSIITDEFPLDQINHAHDLMRKGELLGRAVIKI